MKLVNQQLYEHPRVFVQGDRDPFAAQRAAATQLGYGLREKRWGVTLGAYGGFVKVLEDTGISCICHETEIQDHSEVKASTSPIIDCGRSADLVVALLGGGIYQKAHKEISWAVRLGTWMGTSQAFVFFAGREGTLAHLIPVLSHNIKGWATTEGRPRKVVLLGWERRDCDAIYQLYRLPGKSIDWLLDLPLTQVNDAVDFLTT